MKMCQNIQTNIVLEIIFKKISQNKIIDIKGKNKNIPNTHMP